MTRPYNVHPGWRLLLMDSGVNPANVLRRAELPADLFARERSFPSTEDYFRLWQGIEAEADDPALPLRVGSAISVEAFEPPIFAALCSPDLNTALQRLAHFKPLIGPMRLHVDIRTSGTTLELSWLDTTTPPPAALVAAELNEAATTAERVRAALLEMLPGAEISYLLGYEDPNCFFRAFHDWTGSTPAQARATLQAAN